MYFAYGEEETDYLKKKDKRMAEVIDRIGHVERKVDTDLFSAVVHHIVGQQISIFSFYNRRKRKTIFFHFCFIKRYRRTILFIEAYTTP